MKTLFIILFLTSLSFAQTYNVGQTNANVAAALAMALDADLAIYAGITPSANMQTFLGSANYTAMRSNLSLTIGTNVQAYDADLTTYAGITPSANIQTFLGAADYAAMRTQLGLVIGTNVQAYDANLNSPDLALNLVQDSLDIKMNRSEMSGYASASHTHTEFFDTLSFNINIADTVITGDNAIWKVPNNITIIEVAFFTNTGTVTGNLEERGETTPNTAGTDVMTSDLTGDTDQQESTTFSNAGIAKDAWLALVIASKTGNPTLFGANIRYVKTN